MIDQITDYYSADDTAALLGCSPRQAARLIAKTPDDLARWDYSGFGRPTRKVHFTAHPRLYAAVEERRRSIPVPGFSPPPPPPSEGISAANLAVAKLRAMAVVEYNARRDIMAESAAAVQTVADWRRARSESVTLKRRQGHRKEDDSKDISVGGFTVRTLRRWASLYKESGLPGLAPVTTGKGRPQSSVPEDLVDLIYAYATSTPRADIAGAIDQAKKHWPGQWPTASYSTIVRRVRRRDPARFCETLGKKGIAGMRREHSADINIDYSGLPFNGLWQIDDVTEDFYAHGNDNLRVLRPYIYAIMRVPTRQWVAAVACETKITAAQVRELIGRALSDPAGGIPDRFVFERGTVACDDYLEDLLTCLGSVVKRTSMDGGKVHDQALADRGTGHPQGKGVIERAIQEHHRIQQFARGQVGFEERHTGAARLETLKREAARLAEEGEFLILPGPAQWQAQIHAALDEHNNRTHSAHPRIVDPETGEPRHMTPNEKARSMKNDPVRVMDETLLPLFFDNGVQLKVTKNGVRFNGESYGRWDEGMAELAGTMVTVYGMPELPDAVYVPELGRAIEKDVATQYQDLGTAHIERKRSGEKKMRNEYQRMISSALAAADGAQHILIESTRLCANPTPTRRVEPACPDALRDRATAMTVASGRLREQRKANEERFTFKTGPVRNERGTGLLAQSVRLAAQAKTAIPVHASAPLEDDPFNLFDE